MLQQQAAQSDANAFDALPTEGHEVEVDAITGELLINDTSDALPSV